MTTVTATRTVPGDPASTALLLAGPSALEFWPGISGVAKAISPMSACAALAGKRQRRLVVRAQPPRRTPTAYVTVFSVDADGLPSASGTLRVTRQDWLVPPVPEQVPAHKIAEVAGEPPVEPSAAVSLELRTEVDYDAGVEQEISAAAHAFLDNVAAFAGRSLAATRLPA